MTTRDMDDNEKGTTGSSGEQAGSTTTPQVQTPEKPSQAEGDRDTIDASIEEKEAESGS